MPNFRWRKMPADGWPGWTRWDAAHSPAPCSPPPSSSPRRAAPARPPARRTKKLTPEQRLVAFQALRASGPPRSASAPPRWPRSAGSTSCTPRCWRCAARSPACRRPRPRLGGRRPAAPLPCAVQCVVGGDGRSLSIAAASIVAKVLRDRAMARLALRFPGYGWGPMPATRREFHRDALRRMGPSRHHRPAFGTVSQLSSSLIRRRGLTRLPAGPPP